MRFKASRREIYLAWANLNVNYELDGLVLNGTPVEEKKEECRTCKNYHDNIQQYTDMRPCICECHPSSPLPKQKITKMEVSYDGAQPAAQAIVTQQKINQIIDFINSSL